MKNKIQSICPYKVGTSWYFDDPVKDLYAEGLVSGIDKMLDSLVGSKTLGGFTLFFSDQDFDGSIMKLRWICADKNSGGNWYYNEKTEQMGWLCPNLLKYFKKAPKNIFVSFDWDF